MALKDSKRGRMLAPKGPKEWTIGSFSSSRSEKSSERPGSADTGSGDPIPAGTGDDDVVVSCSGLTPLSEVVDLFRRRESDKTWSVCVWA